MKNKITKEQALGGILAMTIPFVVATCDNSTTTTPKEDPKCKCPNGTAHEPENFPCCGFDDCNCTIAEPAIRNFSVKLDLKNADGSSNICNAAIQDARTKAGSANLEQVKVNGKDITAIIEEAIMGSFNEANNLRKNVFRIVFGRDGGVTIIVDNPTTAYKIKATDGQTIYLHIDYLKSAPADIQQNIIDTVVAMNLGNDLPFEISKANANDTVRMAGVPVPHMVPVTQKT